ncbi:Dehydrogenase patE [Colletotrichum siamense]|uniref:Dehydrogenase patE n=1 Tax=Colletotrichum siamense TaxID=690259 RepID=UPI0018733D36|nr:Dehydrogenase patE [Colletotrichum siamense]KAF5510600.1 Dehydrogenase patE [Colletotrichum siamense]
MSPMSQWLWMALAMATASAAQASSVMDTYDYIIIGGGTAGMTLASRLSAVPENTVLVIEAGSLDNYEAAVMIPRFYPGASGFAPGTRYDWNLTTVPQTFLQGQTVNLTQGQTIGGSSTVNAMIFDRGMPSNYDSWAALGNEGWGFENLLPYFKKSETFAAATPEHASLYGLTHDPACHGYEGPVQSSYLAWSHPNNITKIILDTANGKMIAKGVEFSSTTDGSLQTAVATQEIILSAGALNSPKILQLSGIGPAHLLTNTGINVTVDLPGVGENLQDHPFGLTLASLNPGIPANSDLDNATFDAEQRDLYYAERKGRWTDTIAEALAFIPLYNFTEADLSNNLISSIEANSTQYLHDSIDSTVVAGYEKQTGLIASMHSKGSTAAMELLYVDGGRSVVNILMHPLSRGTVSITSSDPFAPPAIDPRYFSHPYDGQVLVESLRFNRKLLATASIQALAATETLPGTATESDADILSFIKGVTSTEYHYVGTCAMLPKALGGVVDAELKVYGVDGLRVVDASIMPLLPSAHTQATVYAIAEKAADIILGHSVEGRE